jgi:RsmE family RNA methyltransferase
MIIFKQNPLELKFDLNDQHIKVLRPKPNAFLKLTDLNGSIYNIKVIDYDYKTAKGNYTIISTKQVQPKTKRILLQPIIDKNYLDKLCEIAPVAKITDIILLTSDYSNPVTLNIQRLETILIRASEQSEFPFKTNITNLSKHTLIKYIMDNNLEPIILQKLDLSGNSLTTKETTQGNIIIAVGPEGGFSAKELEFFKNSNFQHISLPTNVLPSWLAGFTFFSGLEI